MFIDVTSFTCSHTIVLHRKNVKGCESASVLNTKKSKALKKRFKNATDRNLQRLGPTLIFLSCLLPELKTLAISTVQHQHNQKVRLLLVPTMSTIQ
jgi:hypothetical protein